MDNTDSSFGLAQLIIMIIFIIGYAWFQVRYSDALEVKRNFKRFLILRNLEGRYKPFLSRYFIFYNAPNPKERLLFERRVQKFIDMKQFIPRAGIKVISAEIKAIIAGSAIQITFGYPNVYFRHFWRILVYPDNYYSSITYRYHKGEVNARGIIVMSFSQWLLNVFLKDPKISEIII
jgi:MtfA peptidase